MIVSAWARGLAIAALLSLAFAAGWTANGWRLGQQAASAERDHAQAAAEVSRRVAVAEHAERAEEARRTDALQEVAHAARLAHDRDVSDRRAADAEHRRLLDDARAYANVARHASQGAAATGASAPATGPGLVLTDVLEGVDDTAGELAAAYDDARTAGLACERAHDAVARPRIEAGQVTP